MVIASAHSTAAWYIALPVVVVATEFPSFVTRAQRSRRPDALFLPLEDRPPDRHDRAHGPLSGAFVQRGKDRFGVDAVVIEPPLGDVVGSTPAGEDDAFSAPADADRGVSKARGTAEVPERPEERGH